MMELADKYIIVGDTIKKVIGNYLQSLGYSFNKIEIVPSMNRWEFFQFSFIKENLLKEIVFSYFLIEYEAKVKEGFDVFLHREPNSSYSIQEILKYEHIPYFISNFSLSGYEGSFDERVQQFCDFIISIFNNHLIREWINRDKWEYIPFDWGDYK